MFFSFSDTQILSTNAKERIHRLIEGRFWCCCPLYFKMGVGPHPDEVEWGSNGWYVLGDEGPEGGFDGDLLRFVLLNVVEKLCQLKRNIGAVGCLRARCLYCCGGS